MLCLRRSATDETGILSESESDDDKSCNDSNVCDVCRRCCREIFDVDADADVDNDDVVIFGCFSLLASAPRIAGKSSNIDFPPVKFLLLLRREPLSVDFFLPLEWFDSFTSES